MRKTNTQIINRFEIEFSQLTISELEIVEFVLDKILEDKINQYRIHEYEEINKKLKEKARNYEMLKKIYKEMKDKHDE